MAVKWHVNNKEGRTVWTASWKSSTEQIGTGVIYYSLLCTFFFCWWSLWILCPNHLAHTLCSLSSALFASLPQIKSPTLAGLSEDSSHALTSSDFSLRYLTPDQRVEGLTAFSSHEELDRFNREARQGNRHPELFALCPPADEVRCIHANGNHIR